MADKPNPHWPAPDQAFAAEGLASEAFEATFAGALSFGRRRYTRDLARADVAITGIPLDIATSYRPGARFGPAAVRAASAQLAELRAFPGGHQPYSSLAIADAGDCPFDYGRPHEIAEAIRAHAAGIIAQGPLLIALGGDHFVTYPLLKAHAEKHGALALIQFDAHQDTWADDGVRIDHGTQITRAIKEGLIDTARSVQIGIRTVAPETYGIAILDAPHVHGRAPAEVAAEALAIVGRGPAYLTFDIDCLDPAFAPGTGTPVVGGLSSHQALTILRALGPIDFVGMDLVEVCPPYDHGGITALAGATVVHDFIAQILVPKGRGAARKAAR